MLPRPTTGALSRRRVLSLPALTAVGATGLAVTGCSRTPEVPDMTDPDADPGAGPDAAAAGEPRQVAYGDDPSQYGELTLPDGEPVGVAVLVHGGFWRAQYGLEYAQPLVPSLVDAGWATWVVEYRRVGSGEGGGGGVPETLDDVRAALALLTEPSRTGVDLPLERVVGLGHSAGGHLVTWAAGPHGPGVLTHVISQAGVLDLAGAATAGLGAGAVEEFLGHPYGPEDAWVDPLTQVPLDVPVWCVHGDADTNVPPSQSLAYVEAATAAGARAELVEVVGDHFVVIDPGSQAWSRTLVLLDGLVDGAGTAPTS
ncbi:prolyl oligopeptidase family serine peptidase [Nocardioides sp. GY 10127]|uniref:alpha/beta hydrolase family protein n=1 Tax=Nocardioides sp. GY 10127 TaxID=2569762 RepID=UPI0010A8D4B0|nr:prolyl oligopeptidase family serine peptidase [Nocardioides sp. GY 10127]TIC80184.1 alpha/beta hydrolase [Nocardioides sp. GY 10127]